MAAACPNCGSATHTDAAFCSHCGSLLASDGHTTETALPSAFPNPNDMTFGDSRYAVKQALGRGAIKTVYLVTDTLLDRDVALALIEGDALDDRGRDRVLREAQTMARLGEHPNVVPIYDFGEDDAGPFMVMPVMVGGTLSELIAGRGPTELDSDRIVDIATDVCSGLEFVHLVRVVHRDLKPDNIWLTSDGTAKIGDFGIAHIGGRTRRTDADKVMGTPAYMAPEQGMGHDVDRRTDLYSLGAILYHAVTGSPLFTDSTPMGVVQKHINEAPTPPTEHTPDCSPEMESLILRLLAKDPASRPDSAASVLATLDEITIAGRMAPADGPGALGRKALNVLLVDDSEDDAMLVLRGLRRGGFEVSHQRVDNAAAMQRALEEGTWDVVVSDHSMPSFSSRGALRVLQSSGLDMPFIIVSGTISDEIAVEAMKSGAHDYVMKDNLARLGPAVERELREATVRRARRSAEYEERRVRQDLEQRVKDLTARNALLERRLSAQPPA